MERNLEFVERGFWKEGTGIMWERGNGVEAKLFLEWET